MNLNDILVGVPEGYFRLIGRDNFEDTFFVIGDYKYQEVAVAEQIVKSSDEELLNGKDNEISSSFYVINDKGSVVYPYMNDLK